MKNVLLLGMGPTAVSALESLAGTFHVVGVVRELDESAAVGDEVAQKARELAVPVLPDVSPEAVGHAIIERKPDCVVISSYHRILGAEILQRSKFVNVHYAPLPKYRGRANVNWAIINGDREAAITIHSIVPDVDAGNILFQESIEIGPDDTVGQIYGSLNDIQREILAATVARHLDGYAGLPQDESESTYGCSRVPADGEIDWSKSTKQIYALVRALSPPYPGAYTYLESRRIDVVRVSPVPDPRRYVGRVPGRIVGRWRQAGFVDVLTGDGVLRIHEVKLGSQAESIPAAAAITSTRQTLGLRTADLLARIEDLERRLASLAPPA
jgi:methionyl-tRNA formyltransferase